MVATFVFPGMRQVRIGICVLLAGVLSASIGMAFAAPSYDFAYRVSGDRRVAPQQVFDDGVSTYLQFFPGQVLPALIAVGSDGSQRLLTHAQLGPYVTVSGTHVGLLAQLGNVRAAIDYTGKAARVVGDDEGGLPMAQPSSAPVSPPAASTHSSFTPPWATPAPAQVPGQVAVSAPASTRSAAPTTPTAVGRVSAVALSTSLAGVNGTADLTPIATPSATPLTATPRTEPSRDIKPVTASTDAVVAEPWPLTPSTPPAKPFEATLADQNLRRSLGRWAIQAGWTFRAEHWTPDVDIAVSAPAVFGTDFKAAVRALLAGTELSAKPLQPCFYANLVLRVVAQTERCDRRVAH
jgi:hypothetical protein